MDKSYFCIFVLFLIFFVCTIHVLKFMHILCFFSVFCIVLYTIRRELYSLPYKNVFFPLGICVYRFCNINILSCLYITNTCFLAPPHGSMIISLSDIIFIIFLHLYTPMYYILTPARTPASVSVYMKYTNIIYIRLYIM